MEIQIEIIFLAVVITVWCWIICDLLRAIIRRLDTIRQDASYIAIMVENEIREKLEKQNDQ